MKKNENLYLPELPAAPSKLKVKGSYTIEIVASFSFLPF